MRGEPGGQPDPQTGEAPSPSESDDQALAGRLVAEVGRALLEARRRWHDQERTWWDIEQGGDRLAHDQLVAELARHRPADAVLSEEGLDDGSRHGGQRVWIVDPLDGSADYPHPDGRDFAVHVALVEDYQVTAAAVGLPASSAVYTTAVSPLDRPVDPRPPVVIAGRSGKWLAGRLASHLEGSAVTVGSAGVKAMAVVAGTADVYVHPTELWEWDAAAPAAVAAAAGFHVSGIDGSTLVFNQPRAVVPGLLICRPELASTVLDQLV